MNINDYISLATQTESQINNVSFHKDTLLNIMKLHILSGTLLDNIKKNIFYNKPISDDWDNILTEILPLTKEITSLDDINQLSSETININPRIFHSAVGIATEGTELVEALYNSISDNVELDTVNVLEEIFDVFWYQLIAHDAINANIENTLNIGFDKLRKRYPEKFTSDSAINRNLEAEREILENII